MPEEREVKVKINVEVKGLKDLEKTEQILGKFGKSISASSNKAAEGTKKVGKALGGISYDVDKTAKAARQFSVAWGVPFKDAYTHVKKLGVGVDATSQDISKAGKVARTFAAAGVGPLRKYNPGRVK